LTTGALNHTKSTHNAENYYYILREVPEYPSNHFKNLEKEVQRSTMYKFSKELAEQLVDPLHNIFTAFIKRNPTIGFYSGMTFIARELLRYLTEEQTFWAFTSIVEENLPLDYFADQFGMQVDQKILKSLIMEQFPDLRQHLENADFDMSLIGLDWLTSIFINYLNHETLLFVLSCFFLKGQKVILRIALAIVEILQPHIMKLKKFDQIHMFLQDIAGKVDSKML